MRLDLKAIASDFFKAESARKASEQKATSTRSSIAARAIDACQESLNSTATLLNEAEKTLSKAEWDMAWRDLTPTGSALNRRVQADQSPSLGDITPPKEERSVVQPADPSVVTISSYERKAEDVQVLAKQLRSELLDIEMYRERKATRARWVQVAIGAGITIVIAVALVGGLYFKRRLTAAPLRGPSMSTSEGQAAPSSATAGSNVNVAQLSAGGDFKLASSETSLPTTLRITKDTTIAGAGVGATVLRSGASGAVIVVDQDATLVLRDISVVHVGANAANVIIVDGTLQATNVQVSGGRSDASITGAGIILRLSGKATISRSEITGNGTGLVAVGNSSLFVSKSTILKNLARGISLRNNSSAVISDNTVSRNGYELSGHDYWQGIGLDNSASALISHNTIRSNAGIGIQFRDDSAGSVDNNAIEDNALNIAKYAPAQTSIGGIVLGTRGTSQNPRPTIHSDNNFAGNQGGSLVDYRPTH